MIGETEIRRTRGRYEEQGGDREKEARGEGRKREKKRRRETERRKKENRGDREREEREQGGQRKGRVIQRMVASGEEAVVCIYNTFDLRMLIIILY